MRFLDSSRASGGMRHLTAAEIVFQAFNLLTRRNPGQAASAGLCECRRSIRFAVTGLVMGHSLANSLSRNSAHTKGRQNGLVDAPCPRRLVDSLRPVPEIRAIADDIRGSKRRGLSTAVSPLAARPSRQNPQPANLPRYPVSDLRSRMPSTHPAAPPSAATSSEMTAGSARSVMSPLTCAKRIMPVRAQT